MSDSESEDEPNFFSAAREDDEEEEVTFPVGGGGNLDSEEEEEVEVVEEVDLGSPIYVVFNRRVTPKLSNHPHSHYQPPSQLSSILGRGSRSLGLLARRQ